MYRSLWDKSQLITERMFQDMLKIIKRLNANTVPEICGILKVPIRVDVDYYVFVA